MTKKLLFMVAVMSAPAWASHNNIYDIKTDTLTITRAIVWPNGSVQVASPTAGGGSTAPGGATTDVQFNNSNTFGGSGNFTWDNTGNNLSLSGTGAGAGISIEGFTIGTSNPFIGGFPALNATDLGALQLLCTGGVVTTDSPLVVQSALSVGTAPDPSVAFEVDSTSQGFLPPRVSTNSISSPIEGLITYSSTTHHFMGFNGSAWKQLDN